MAQTKQIHRTADVVRYLENGQVIGWEGIVPPNTTEEDWIDSGEFDPYTYLGQAQVNRLKRRNSASNKRLNATRNLYLKLIEKGYSDSDARGSTGYDGE